MIYNCAATLPRLHTCTHFNTPIAHRPSCACVCAHELVTFLVESTDDWHDHSAQTTSSWEEVWSKLVFFDRDSRQQFTTQHFATNPITRTIVTPNLSRSTHLHV